MVKYLKLDPETSDLTIIRIIKVRTGYRCIDIRGIMVSKWKTKLTSLAGRKLGLRNLMARKWEQTSCYKSSNCGNILKQFQPNKCGNTICGTGNDSWYGKIEIDARKEMGNPQPSTTILNKQCERTFCIMGQLILDSLQARVSSVL